MPLTTSRAAAQYLRMSSDSQTQSLTNQASVIRDYAYQHGYSVVRSYEDSGRSGVTADGRDGLAALLLDVISGEAPFKTILVLDVSRWGRYQDPDEAAHYEFLCRSAGVEVQYCGEAFGEGYASSIMKQLKRVMAGEYSRELSEKVWRGKRRHAELGHSPGGPCPYGLQRREYAPDGRSIRVLARHERKSHPEHFLRLEPGSAHEVDTVRRIFNAYVNRREHPLAIAARLNRDGGLWKDGTPWTSARVVRLLQMDWLVGRQFTGKSLHRLGAPRVAIPSVDWDLVHLFEPVVSPKLFEAARRRRLALNGSKASTSEEMLKDLRRVLKKHGRISGVLIDEMHGVGRSDAYYSRFGSLKKAYAHIGYVYDPHRRSRVHGPMPSRELLIEALQAIQKKHGRVSVTLIERDKTIHSTYYIRLVFGSIPEAYEAAGVKGGRGLGPRARNAADAREKLARDRAQSLADVA